MNCPICNAPLREGAAFCTNCGNPTTQPQYSPVLSVSKGDYLRQAAPEKVRTTATVTVVIMLVALALIVAGVVGTLTMNVFEVPAMSFIMTVSEADPQELLTELDEQVYEMESSYEYAKEDMDAAERKDAEQLLNVMGDLADTFSILNFQRLMDLVTELNVTRGLGVDVEDMQAVEMLIGIMFAVIIGFFVLPVLFVLLGGLLKNTPLTVIGLIFTLISQLILCAPLWTVTTLAALIVQIVLCTKVNGAYKAYRNGAAA